MSEQGVAPTGDAGISARDAGALISSIPAEPAETNSEAVAPETAAEPAKESTSQEAEAAPPETEPSGETEETAPEETPSIDPPRSWTKEDKAVFATLPRETQERLLALDRTREVELRRGQNEAAERAKAVEAREQAAEQARQHYEQALPALLAQMNAEYRREFGNPTWDEIGDWSRTEPEKYLRWDASYKRIQAQAAEVQQATNRENEQAFEARKKFAERENHLLRDKAPELFGEDGPTKAKEAKAYMAEVGFTSEEMTAFYEQFAPITLHDHRFQLLVYDAMRFREAQKAAKKASPKPVPPVQRPGTASVKGEGQVTQFKTLETQLDRTGNLRDAAKLLGARRRAS